MTKKLPNFLYAYRDSDGSDEWFIANETPRECANRDGVVFVGKYELKETMNVSLKVDLVVKKAS